VGEDPRVMRIIMRSSVPVFFEYLPRAEIAQPYYLVRDVAQAKDWLFKALADFYGVACDENMLKSTPKPDGPVKLVNYAFNLWALRTSCRDAALNA
jgi:hypothetical protein